MKNIQNKFTTLLTVCFLVLLMNACTPAGGNFGGSEFMPDMVHSTAYEANYYDYYYYNTWGTEDEYYKMAGPRKPVAGTIPRGYAGIASATSAHDATDKMAMMRGAGNGMSIPLNGSVPYYYKDTEPERARAIAEIINNPYPITEHALEEGEELYQIYCGICHGKKADGDGFLVRDNGGKYPSQPPSFINTDFTAASNGRFYHAIMHGKNVMGSHADKLSYEERWNVIHYIRSLQAKNAKLKYNHIRNTLNESAVPGGSKPAVAMNSHDDHEHDAHEDDHGHDAHDNGATEHEEEGNHDHGDATHQEESDHGHDH